MYTTFRKTLKNSLSALYSLYSLYFRQYYIFIEPVSGPLHPVIRDSVIMERTLSSSKKYYIIYNIILCWFAVTLFFKRTV